MNFNFNIIIDFLQDLNQRYAITSLFQEREAGYILTQHELIAILVILVIGLLWCFAGHLMVRLWAALMGLGLGFSFGAIVASLFTSDPLILIISGGVLGLIFGILAGFILPLGIFLVTLLTVFGFMAVLLSAQSVTMLIVALVIGLIFAIITFKFPEPIIIIITALCGAFVAAETLYILVNYNLIIYAVVVIALAVGGMCTQFLFENGKRKRQHLDKANEIKENKSRDSEIERARSLVDILEEEPVQEVTEEKKESKKEKVKKEKSEKKEKQEKKSRKEKKQPVIVFSMDTEDEEDEEIEEVAKVTPTHEEKEIDKSKSIMGTDEIEEEEFQINIEEKVKEPSMDIPTIDEGKERKAYAQAVKEKSIEKTDEAVKREPREKVEVAEKKEPREKVAEAVKRRPQEIVEDVAEGRPAETIDKTIEEKSEAALEWQSEQRVLELPEETEVNADREKATSERDFEEGVRIRNIQKEEESEREAARLEKAKRDWINQLVSDRTPRD